jgi:ArsR family transcriptional regulator, cadmium/lead-responsive transcriptional repressor
MLLMSEKLEFELKAKLFRGFADPSRLSILEALRVQPLNVGEIGQATGLSQSNISNHLSCLRDCGLVTSEQRSRYTYYRLADERIERLLRLAEEVLSDVAQGVYQCTRYAGPTELNTELQLDV